MRNTGTFHAVLDHKAQIKKYNKLKLGIVSNSKKEVASDEESIWCKCQISITTCQDKNHDLSFYI